MSVMSFKGGRIPVYRFLGQFRRYGFVTHYFEYNGVRYEWTYALSGNAKQRRKQARILMRGMPI